MLASLCIAAGCQPAPPHAGLIAGEKGVVTFVQDGDTLHLESGQRVKLVGLEAPARGTPAGDGSHLHLLNLVLGRQVQLFYAGLTRDRYDRALAHVMTFDDTGPRQWVNKEMVAAGAAWVRIYPDNSRAHEALFAAEAEARATGLGLWTSDSSPRVAKVEDLAEIERRFVIVDVRLGAAQTANQNREVWACERVLSDTVVRLRVALEAREACDIESGTEVEIRAWQSRDQLTLAAIENVRPPGSTE